MDIVCDPIVIRLVTKGVRSYHPEHGRDAELDIEVVVDAIEITLTQHGGMLNVSILQDPVALSVTIHGKFNIATFIECDPIVITLSQKGSFFVSTGPENWIAWSRIGHLNFVWDKTNVVGERPADWHGVTFGAYKLGNTVVIYGDNGVSLLAPADIKWGIRTIHRIGVLCKGAIAGTESEHYFIDKEYRLYRLTPEGLELLEYSEYLRLLANPIISLDISESILYICDGAHGFVYGTKTKSFGEGPKNITGIGYRDGNLYVVSPSIISTPKFSICTDIYDLGTRKPKTIQEVEIGVDLINDLEVRIEARLGNKFPFVPSRWVLVNPKGIAYLPCYGVEFKFRLRSYIYEYFEVDYIKAKGNIHEFGGLEAIA